MTLIELRKLANEWIERECDEDDIRFDGGSTSINKLMRAYIAAANPAAVISLLDQIEEQQAENDRLNDDVAMHMRVAVKAIDEVVELKDQRDAIAAKLVTLEAEAERYRWFADIAVSGDFGRAEAAFACFEDAESCTKEELQAENERLTQDRNLEKKLRKDSDERAHNAEAERDALAAKLEALEADAERYRFAFNNLAIWNYAICKLQDAEWLPIGTLVDEIELDAAIDAAKGGQHEDA